MDFDWLAQNFDALNVVLFTTIMFLVYVVGRMWWYLDKCRGDDADEIRRLNGLIGKIMEEQNRALADENQRLKERIYSRRD